MGFTLGGKTTAELGLEWIDENTQIPNLPATRDRTVEVPGRSGKYYFGAELREKPFYLDCTLKDVESQADVEQKIEALNQHLLQSNGTPQILSLMFDMKPGKTYFVYYSSPTPLNPERIGIQGRFLLPLVAFDPHAYGAEQEIEQLVEASPEAIAVTSSGNVETPPVIILENEGTNTINGFTIRRYIEID